MPIPEPYPQGVTASHRRNLRRRRAREAKLFTIAATPLGPDDPRRQRARPQWIKLTVPEAKAVAQWAGSTDHWVPVALMRSALLTLAAQDDGGEA